MSSNDYFQIYIQTIAEAFRRVKKIGFKKYSQIKDLIETTEYFLAKEVYGRIEPSSYLMVMIVILGSKSPKLYPPIISAVQRLFSYNFIAPNEDIVGSIKLLKQQHKEFLLLPFEDYNQKSFKQIYIETLVNLAEKDEGLNINVAKSLSLIWRLDQNNIPLSLLPKMFDYLLDCMAVTKVDDQQKLLKSVVLQMFRHSLQSYREVYDRKFLYEDNSISLRGVCNKYGLVIADAVAIRLDIALRYGIDNYLIIPPQNSQEKFDLYPSQQINEKKITSGKFGWCTFCRKAANYYCKINRLPVCSFECKQEICHQLQDIEKFLAEEQRSLDIFENHIIGLFSLCKKYLGHADNRKRFCFSETFVLMTSQLKKIIDKLSPKSYKELRGVVRQAIVNISAQSDSFIPCMITLKKLLQLRIFLDETEILLRLFAKKLTHFLTPNYVRDEILKFLKEIINNRFLFDAAMALDCSTEHYDAVREVIDSIRQVYIGIPVPQAISIPPAQDANAKRLSLEICLILLKSLQQNERRMSTPQAEKLITEKAKLNLTRNCIDRFNKTDRPLKITKKLIEEAFLPAEPQNIARYIHQNRKRLNPTNIGALIGDIDEFAGQIRNYFIGSINFHNLPIDEGMRVLLKHFTLPGQSQVVQRIIETFGITYFDQNRLGGVFANSDAVFSLSYLIMMLQSNLHNPTVVDKMTLPQFSHLSKGMNGDKDAEFPAEFLENIYTSVQRTPLGVHQKLKQIEIMIAFNTNPKKAQQIYLKSIQKQATQTLGVLQQQPMQMLPQSPTYPYSIFIEEFVSQILDMLAWKIKELDEKEKEQIIKCIQLMQTCLRIANQGEINKIIERGIEKIWEEIQRASVNKKYLLVEAMFEWARKFGEQINEQWKVVIFMISKFYRIKAIKKDNNSNKSNVLLVVVQNRCYLYDSYIDNLMAKSAKFSLPNLIGFLRALLTVSREQINDGGCSFSLQKINQVLEQNASRSLDIMNIFWNQLRQYYSELGRHKVEKIAMFASDFLKQLITKFLKRKDLIVLQRQYLRPFEQIFLGSKIFAVKQLMIGGLNYFLVNHYGHLRSGWKTVLSVICACFEQQEHPVIKEKGYAVLRKISDSNFSIFHLEENYNDFVQILNRLARQKQENYALGCLQIIKQIVDYYHKLLEIDLDKGPQAPENAKLDINFWQTIFLPLLSIIFPICGDSRTNVQLPAIKSLFDILFRYGKLFKYQFWKMVLQGVLRPAFEEITYTSQSKPLKKAQLEAWLKNSFTELFKSINKLIVLYYEDFRLFLEDVFKIYENCILNHSLKLLIVLSLDALTDLLQKIALNFEEHDWQTFLQFAQSLLKKTLPVEISSLDAWNKSKDLLQNNYEAKCFALFLFLSKSQQIYQKFPGSITEKIYLNTLNEIEPIYLFVTNFNQSIELRQILWKNGFYQEVKMLPGLIKHHYEILKFKSRIYFKLVEINPLYVKEYFQHVLFIFEKTNAYRLKEHLKEPSTKDYEKERISVNFKMLLQETILQQLQRLGSKVIFEANMGQRLMQQALNLIGSRTYCVRCQFCQTCQNNCQNARILNEQLQNLILMLFKNK